MNSFPRTLRSLSNTGTRFNGAAVILALVLALAWGLWLTFGTTHVYATSAAARVEVSQHAHPVQPRVDGAVLKSNLELGALVKEGDILVRLDPKADELRLERNKKTLVALEHSVDALQGELDSLDRAMQAHLKATGASSYAAQARGNVAASEAAQARREHEMTQKLARNELATGMDAVRSGGLARQKLAMARATRAEAVAVSRMGKATTSDRQAAIASLNRQKASLDGEIATLKPAIAELENTIALHTIRATVTGKLAEVAPLTPGMLLSVGQRLATIVPDTALRVVGQFDPSSALGRIAPGQQAVMRLDSFPWAQYGTLPCTVARVGAEPRNGLLRVELDISVGNPRVPVSHGLTGSVEVQTEQVSPGILLLRAAGQALAGPVVAPPVRAEPETDPASGGPVPGSAP